MLFHHADIVDGHAPVHRLAHVVNGEQRRLDGRKGFHFHAGGPNGFNGGGAKYAYRVRLAGVGRFKLNSDARQRERMAQRNQLTGLLGPHDPCNARDAQHIAFFGGSGLDQCQGGRLHFNAPDGNSRAMGGSLAADVHHVGLALCVEVGELGSGHCSWAKHFGDKGIIRRTKMPPR